jgi:hypothetical protein
MTIGKVESITPRSPEQAALYNVQLQEWPDSEFLTDDQLVAGLKADPVRSRYRNIDDTPINWAERVRRYREDNPDAVAYSVVDGTGRTCYGMRYGSEGHEYISF